MKERIHPTGKGHEDVMTKEELKWQLQEKGMKEALELLEEAEQGELAELELVESLGLLRDEHLNNTLIEVLQNEGVEIIYIPAEE
ncbi:hypothetical protein [Salibacterium lacus]|uniref:RNA polymerase sigma factor 70 region 1.1 domain-containing protein n=1 Tax=Salibacterium lacus TaxID=1898109 RepID=A0ABW5T0U9_9BACI